MTQSQKRALDAVQNMIEVKTDEVFAHNIMILIFGILNIEHDMDKDTSIPIIPDNGNDKLQVPEWIKNVPTPPFSPHDPFPPKVWYNQEPELTKIDCTDNKNGIVYISNNTDTRYTGDFRDGQTSFNDK